MVLQLAFIFLCFLARNQSGGFSTERSEGGGGFGGPRGEGGFGRGRGRGGRGRGRGDRGGRGGFSGKREFERHSGSDRT